MGAITIQSWTAEEDRNERTDVTVHPVNYDISHNTVIIMLLLLLYHMILLLLTFIFDSSS